MRCWADAPGPIADAHVTAGRSLDAAVIGCGTAGAAAALFLVPAGHPLTAHQPRAAPVPAGAGVLLHPPGQAPPAPPVPPARGPRPRHPRCATGRAPPRPPMRQALAARRRPAERRRGGALATAAQLLPGQRRRADLLRR